MNYWKLLITLRDDSGCVNYSFKVWAEESGGNESYRIGHDFFLVNEEIFFLSMCCVGNLALELQVWILNFKVKCGD